MAGIQITPGAGNTALRETNRLAQLGLLSLPWYSPTNSAALTSQAVYGCPHYLYAGETVTNIVVHVQTAGTSTIPTSIKVALWSSAATPVCLAVSGELNNSANWTAQGFKVSALSAPYVVPTDGLYYACFWENGAFAGTALALSTLSGSGVVGGAIGSNKQMGGTVKTGAGTMAVNDTGTFASSANFWIALS